MRPPCTKTLRNSAFTLLLLLPGALQAQNTIHYDAQPGSKIRIDGTSTFHDWTAEANMIGGFMEVDPAFDADLKTLTTTPKVEVTILVRQLKNPKNEPTMDKRMHSELKQQDHPSIQYRLLNLTPKTDATAGSASQFDAKGELTISGVTRTNSMPVSFERIDKSKIKVKGATALKMSDFGIKPPSFLGAMRTGDEVKLTFEWITAKAEKTAAAK